jgi:hypothetical protein
MGPRALSSGANDIMPIGLDISSETAGLLDPHAQINHHEIGELDQVHRLTFHAPLPFNHCSNLLGLLV